MARNRVACLELLELALLAGGGEGPKGDGRGVGQVKGLADRCHGGGQLASSGLPGGGAGGVNTYTNVGGGQLGGGGERLVHEAHTN